jgi:hypothetical protein
VVERGTRAVSRHPRQQNGRHGADRGIGAGAGARRVASWEVAAEGAGATGVATDSRWLTWLPRVLDVRALGQRRGRTGRRSVGRAACGSARARFDQTLLRKF